GEGLPRISGNVLTGGAGLPQLHGRIERHGDGTAGARFTMAEYVAGDTRLSLPSLVLAQTRGGELGFSGRAELSGAVPDGRIDRLVVPLDGNWSARRGLSAWRSCTPLSFRSVKLANLTLDPRQLTLCPGADGAILRSDERGTRIAALARSLSLAGRIKDTPLRLASGPVAINWPGKLSASTVAVEVGSVQYPTTVKLAQLTGLLGKEISGTFTGAEVKLSAVPLDVLDGTGQWRFADSDLWVSGAAFRLEDRSVDDRFRPLISHDAELHLHGSDFTAEAMLREPRSDREVVKADITHDMDDGKGHAILTVPGLVFDNAMQPDTLTALALGVIANAKGTVTGGGRIDWDADNVTSTGTFSTQGLDFAAAFGPTKGLRGTVEFSDLLGLVTKRDQKLQIASINPGIEVDNGEVSFQLEGNNVLVVNGANWPFVDGTLELLPTRMVLGASEVRRYTLRLRGANAAKFVQQLELGNVSAEGIFDGDIPIVFDENGGHIVAGMLVSRAPGGNVSYVGELTYKDLSPMANFAFQSLRSLDYKRMEIGLDGNLDGEIFTRMRFDGVTQGVGAKQNIATRAIKGLPIQFNVNIRAPFQRLVTSFKSTYDPSYVQDPRTLGLVPTSGSTPQKPATPAPGGPQPGQPATPPPAPGLTNDPKNIQPPVSRNRP
uniref:intermembrane phospholipid transport protein YdbH family protein n=1 Tax=Novosphingobium sp. TaxID=1874826 RepID=UPI0035B4D661